MTEPEAKAHAIRLQVAAKLRQIESLFTDLRRFNSQAIDYLAQEKGLLAAGQLGLFGLLLNTVCDLTDEAFELMPTAAQKEARRCLQKDSAKSSKPSNPEGRSEETAPTTGT